jgi:glycosyltransferase involved in cell wall biosynthesis
MKIVVVHNTYQQPGGEDIVFHNECELLRGAGHDVIPYQRSNHDVSNYVSVRQLALAKNTIWASDTRKAFRDLLLQERPDVVHVHNTFVMMSPSIYWACRDASVPVVQTLHNYRLLCPGATFFRDGKVCEDCLGHGVWRSVRHSCYQDSGPASAVVAAMLTTHRVLGTWSRLIDYFLAPTEFARRKFIQGGLPAEKILVKPNFVDPDPGAGTGRREYAAFVGRLSRWLVSRRGRRRRRVRQRPLARQSVFDRSRQRCPTASSRLACTNRAMAASNCGPRSSKEIRSATT